MLHRTVWFVAWASAVWTSTSSSTAQQSAADVVERLREPATRARATSDCRRLGAAAATALVDALARPDERAPDVLAEVLAELGDATGGELARLAVMLPKRREPLRTSLLRALANGVLACRDRAAVDRLVDELPGWAQQGFFYSEAADRPSFAWFEYVRLRRRLALRDRGTGPAELTQALDTIRQGRVGLQGFGGGPLGGGPLGGGGAKSDTHDLSAFGQHATREELEAIAELALPHGEAACDVVAELARYLRNERPRPGEVLRESQAGYGENAPVDAPAVAFPTLWRRDDWRFAIARAVVALAADAGDRTHALRHLLHGPTAADRLDALAAVRAWPPPWEPFAPDLAACLDAADRVVVREALVTLGLAEGCTLPAAALARLAAGSDRELATLATRLLPK